jgi:hypothetical protein
MTIEKEETQPLQQQRPLSGALTLNRKKSRGAMQSPLASEPIKDRKVPMIVEELYSKLDIWERTALAMVQDIQTIKASLSTFISET